MNRLKSLLQQPDFLLGGTLLAALAAVGAALISQHQFNMQPCPWCVLQRIIFLAMALGCLIGLVGRHWLARCLAASLTLILAGCGIAAALWQHFVAAKSASCALTFADKVIIYGELDSYFPEIFAVRASCSEAATQLLGIPYEFWSLALYMVLAGMMVQTFRVSMRRR